MGPGQRTQVLTPPHPAGEPAGPSTGGLAADLSPFLLKLNHLAGPGAWAPEASLPWRKQANTHMATSSLHFLWGANVIGGCRVMEAGGTPLAQNHQGRRWEQPHLESPKEPCAVPQGHPPCPWTAGAFQSLLKKRTHGDQENPRPASWHSASEHTFPKGCILCEEPEKISRVTSDES